ncbi:MAG: DUF362 domain-containing protein, partial [Candidatus Saccharibacteria bacterium]
MNRREFLKLLLAAGLISVELFEKLSLTAQAAEVVKKPGLIVAQGSNPVQLIDKGLQAMGGINRFVKKGNLVVIKPNFSVPRAPSVGATTNPELVAALVKKCLAAGAREVRVVDYPFNNPRICKVKSGMEKAVKDAGGKLYTLEEMNSRNYKEVKLKGPILRSASYSRDVLEANVFINFPILKHHGSTTLTMGLKNLMGLVYDRGIFHATDLDRTIAELAMFKKPHLTILDAMKGITDNGPMGPGPIKKY